MQIFDADVLKEISFPDVRVEKMEFLPNEKMLKVSINRASLDIGEGTLLGKGVLFFYNWENISIRKYDTPTKEWSDLDPYRAETLVDLCETTFFDSNVSLCGFSKESGQWLEWKIINTQMHAEFE